MHTAPLANAVSRNAGAISNSKDVGEAETLLNMIGMLVEGIQNASARVDAAIDRLSGPVPKAVSSNNGSAQIDAPRSVLSKLQYLRELLDSHNATMQDHANRLERFI